MNGDAKKNPDEWNDATVTSLIREAAEAAELHAARMPPPDTDAILAEAARHRRVARTWAPRIAAAAAVLAAAAGALTLVGPRPLPSGPVPEHLVALVESLYAGGDYVVDQLGPVMRGRTGDPGNGYMTGVWDSVLTELENR